MTSSALMQQPEFREAYLANDRQERLNTGKVAAILVVVLMPVGAVLDYFVYPDKLVRFLGWRVLCSVLAFALYYLHRTELGRRYYRLLGLPIALLPAAFITLMIYETEGPVSPYYAGLNLILLAVSAVVHWTLRESLLAVGSILLMYLAACFLKGTPEQYGIIFNNFYFLVLTGLIVATGNYLFNRLRFREFALRFELDRNRQQLEENNQKLLELDQAKSRFFANVSHELRTPLTLLLAPLETLGHRFGKALDREARDLLATMHSNAMRLLKLINDLLDLVRLESGRIQIMAEPLALVEMVKGLASAIRQMAEDKHVRLECRVDEQIGIVLVDRDKLEKVLLNLLFNALKFTPAGGRVELSAEKQAEHLVFRVSDTGIGISMENLPHVFDRFWQADDSSRRKYQGLGIGLALVKELVEVQAGSVAVESEEGKGATFTLRLPFLRADLTDNGGVAEEPAPSPGGATAGSDGWLTTLYRRAELFPAMTSMQNSVQRVETEGDPRRPKILVADDEPDMLRFLRSQLSAHYQFMEALDGQQAVERASQFLPDIILLDMMMPEKDGLQACRELRARTPTQAIPIILLTARADEETKLTALQAGASDFLTKPFSTTELHVRIKNLAERHDYERRLARQNRLLEKTIEQLKETETQLVQSEKLASLGRMSAGIIHEINNPLNFATTGLYTLRNKGTLLAAEEREGYAEVLRDVEEGLTRVKTIVTDLRTFTYQDVAQMDQVTVAEVIECALRFLSHEWREKVRIVEGVPEDLKVCGNKSMLIHVLVNLLQNSLDALKQKQFDNGEEPTIWMEGRREGARTVLRVRDNGMGIGPEHMDKIFDPFYTTKDVGQGMGLGLSICYRIMQQHGGTISVQSQSGKHCEFALEFPGKE